MADNPDRSAVSSSGTDVLIEYDQWLERIDATYRSVAFCCWHRLGDRVAADEVSAQVVAHLVAKPAVFRYFGLPFSGRIARSAERGIAQAKEGTLPTSRGWPCLIGRLQQVPLEHREILVLACIDNLDDTALAEALGCDTQAAQDRKVASMQYWDQLASGVLGDASEVAVAEN